MGHYSQLLRSDQSASLATMKTFLALCCLVAAASAVPQSQAMRDRIKQRLFNSENNPCGAGVKPSSCTCPDGTTFTPGSGWAY